MIGPLLPLFVIVPLAAAALAVLLPQGATTRVLYLGVPAVGSGAGVALLVQHAGTPVIAHQVGDFDAGISIPFVSDTFSALMLTVTGLVTLVCSWFAVATAEHRIRFLPALALMLTAGVNGAVLTGDLFNLFVFIEVMLLPSYALIALTGTWRRLGVGRLFVLVNLLTSTIFLVGVALVYGVAGTVNLAELAAAAREDDRVALAGAVVLIALSVKAAVVPVHGWLTRAYPATSAAVMALFSGLHTKVAIYAIYRIYAVVYDGDPRWLWLIVTVTCVTILVGAFGAFGEPTIRRALAFQMVNGVGYILLGVALFSVVGLTAGIFYLVHHMITMGGLLLAAGAVEQTYGSGRVNRLSGLARREPVIAATFALGALSLVGLPPSSGFFGKVAVVGAASSVGGPTQVVVVGAVIVASLGALVVLSQLWTTVFWGPGLTHYRPPDGRGQRLPSTTVPDTLRARPSLVAPGAVLIGCSLAMFVGSGPMMAVAGRAADGLVDLGPYVQAVLG